MKPNYLLAAFAFACLAAVGTATARQPNIVIFYLDDMAWGQLSCYGGKLAPTPNMDALAKNGVRFTDGYVSACVCAPSRVALLTGRYQARTGHDANTGRPGSELDLKEVTLAQRLKSAGYATGIVGKWHLGDGPEYLPISRGFDFSVGSVDNLGAEGGKSGFYRGKELLESIPGAPITTPMYAAEAIKFIDSHQRESFFLYLAFNAIHTPHVASETVLKRFAYLPRREQAYAAIIAEADDAIGQVTTRLRELGLEEETLIFCIADNGGAAGFPEFGGLRGHKWLLWEGGIREPWIVQWKGHFPSGRVLSEPVIQLDVMPTALAAAGVEIKPEWQLDGMNLLPLLAGQAETVDRDALYWRFGVQFAVRQGDWKLVKAAKDVQPMLVNLSTDPGEKTDLSSEQPEREKALLALWQKWNAQMQPPRWEDRRWDGEEARQAKKQKDKGKKKAK